MKALAYQATPVHGRDARSSEGIGRLQSFIVSLAATPGVPGYCRQYACRRNAERRLFRTSLPAIRPSLACYNKLAPALPDYVEDHRDFLAEGRQRQIDASADRVHQVDPGPTQGVRTAGGGRVASDDGRFSRTIVVLSEVCAVTRRRAREDDAQSRFGGRFARRAPIAQCRIDSLFRIRLK
jgi:hypothetical protein